MCIRQEVYHWLRVAGQVRLHYLFRGAPRAKQLPLLCLMVAGAVLQVAVLLFCYCCISVVVTAEANIFCTAGRSCLERALANISTLRSVYRLGVSADAHGDNIHRNAGRFCATGSCASAVLVLHFCRGQSTPIFCVLQVEAVWSVGWSTSPPTDGSGIGVFCWCTGR